MNIPPIFPLLAQSPDVTNLISNPDGTIRAFRFGLADEGTEMPYVVWRNISGTSDNNIDDRPNGDQVVLQIDVYGADDEIVDKLAKAVRYAIELDCNVISYRDIDQDPITADYHIGFDVMWLLAR
ncbi:MAG: DUF3168 domain-containing protein [Pseudomonadota bacterium]